eukprot:scaffold74205_cov15-Tisochrysis_lutea.AAC.1
MLLCSYTTQVWRLGQGTLHASTTWHLQVTKEPNRGSTAPLLQQRSSLLCQGTANDALQKPELGLNLAKIVHRLTVPSKLPRMPFMISLHTCWNPRLQTKNVHHGSWFVMRSGASAQCSTIPRSCSNPEGHIKTVALTGAQQMKRICIVQSCIFLASFILQTNIPH